MSLLYLGPSQYQNVHTYVVYIHYTVEDSQDLTCANLQEMKACHKSYYVGAVRHSMHHSHLYYALVT
jgi:hypothetical protein